MLDLGATNADARRADACDMRMWSSPGAVERAVEPKVRAQTEEGRDTWRAHEVRLVWCGSYDAVRRLYPSSPQSQGDS